MASEYSDPQLTAWGKWFDPHSMTAAHRTLPRDTRVEVKNLANGRRKVVRIEDRGPYIHGRCLDLTPVAMRAIRGDGLARVVYRIKP